MSAKPIQVDNMTALSYLLKTGGKKNTELMQISKEIWRVSTWAGDHDYCQTFTKESQLQGRLGISEPEIFLRMETLHSNF